MIHVTFKEVAEFTHGRMNDRAKAMQDEYIKGVSIDTRTIEKGNLFVPFKGGNVDGHRFIEDAFNKEAGLSLTEKPLSEENGTLPLVQVEDGLTALQELAKAYLNIVSPKIIAITGSNGKTTTKDMVECVLRPYYKVQKTSGNYNNEIGLPLTLLALRSDTEISILEMGMDGQGDINFLSEMTQPDIAIITNIGESHIEKLGSVENIASAKYEITDGLKDNGTFIYSKDSPALGNIMDEDVNYNVQTGGISEDNNLRISNVEQTKSGTLFYLSTGDYVEIPQLGAHNAQNATLALLAAEALGHDIYETKEHFVHLKVTAMRMEQMNHHSGALIINDAYNASPSSMKSAIDTVDNMAGAKKVLVLADILELGEYSRRLHEDIGEYINGYRGRFDSVITYGDETKYIHDKIDIGVDKMHVTNLKEMADKLSPLMTEEAVVLLKGSRGMEVERVMDYIS